VRRLAPCAVLALIGSLAMACGAGEPAPTASEPRACEEMECYRPYICVETCDGPVISSGCCSCGEGQIDRFVDCREESEPAPPAAAEPESLACSTAADCAVVTDCSCDCVPRLASEPPLQGEAWQTQCDGSPPPNCGVQSPCADMIPTCDEGQCGLTQGLL